MNMVVNSLDRASFWLARMSAALVVTLATGFITALLLQVIFRYLLNAPLSWSEELSTFLFVWATLLSASYGVRTQEHLRLTFVLDLLDGRARKTLEVFIHVLVGGFGVFLIYNGWRLADLVWDNTSAAIGYPAGFLYSSVPVSGGLIALHVLAHIARMLTTSAGADLGQDAVK